MWIGGGISVAMIACLAGPLLGSFFRRAMENILPWER
jgi:hypothetical protein